MVGRGSVDTGHIRLRPRRMDAGHLRNAGHHQGNVDPSPFPAIDALLLCHDPEQTNAGVRGRDNLSSEGPVMSQPNDGAEPKPVAEKTVYPHDALSDAVRAKGKRFRARHEAAHGVVYHELGEKIVWIDTNQCHMDWSEAAQTILLLRWPIADRGQRQWRQKAWDLITGLVAGPLIESEMNPNAPTVATLMQQMGFGTTKSQTDREKVSNILRMLDRRDPAEIAKAEARALQIINSRRARLDAIFDGIEKHSRLEGEALDTALKV